MRHKLSLILWVLWKTLMSTYVVDIRTNNQACIRLTSSLLLRPFHKQTTVICSCHQPKYFDFVIYSWNKSCKNLCFSAYQEEPVCVEKGPSKYCVFGLLMGIPGAYEQTPHLTKVPPVSELVNRILFHQIIKTVLVILSVDYVNLEYMNI